MKHGQSPVSKYILFLEKHRHISPENLCTILGDKDLGFQLPSPFCVGVLQEMDVVPPPLQRAAWGYQALGYGTELSPPEAQGLLVLFHLTSFWHLNRVPGAGVPLLTFTV